MMPKTASALHASLAAVCPISGVSIGSEDDRSTWSFSPLPQATVDEVAAAQTVLMTFDIVNVIKNELILKVDEDAERVRLRYITPGAGMAMTYQEKFAQAQAVNALGQDAANALTQQQRDASFPTLSASVGIEATTLWDCAQLVLTKYAQFAALSRVIETTRLAGKKAISDASDAAAAQDAYDAIVWLV